MLSSECFSDTRLIVTVILNSGLSVRTNLLIEYAEHLLTDPSLWRVTLEYLGACGKEGRAMVAEVIMRVPVDISIPPSISPNADAHENEARINPATPAKGTGGSISDLEMILADNGMVHNKDDAESQAWKEWEDKVLKIIDVCKDYGLEEVLCSACRVRSGKCHFFPTGHNLEFSPFRKHSSVGDCMAVPYNTPSWPEMDAA